MEAPKKVQIGLKINDYDDWEIQGYSFLEDKQVGMTEYTRTDAFIEKACDWLKNNTYSVFVQSCSLFDAVERFVKHFKQAMEGGEA